MLSAIIATHESERTLVPTLAALVPGATAGLLKEVIVADAGSKDATREVADIAGCRFMSSDKPLGARLRAAAEHARAPWLLFLCAGTVLEPAWIESVDHFIREANERGELARAAVFHRVARDDFRPGFWETLVLWRAMFDAKGTARPEQGLLIARLFYQEIGGHRNEAEPEAALLRRLGRQIVTLRAGARCRAP